MAVVDALTRQAQPQRAERERQIKRLADLPHRADILAILIRELNRAKSGRPMQIIGELLVELGSIATLQEPLWQLIEQPAIRDDAKDVANLVLRHLGDEADPELYLDFLEDPEGLITRETQRMLETSLSNPEALVDFIDFIFSLDDVEQVELLDSLQADYNADQLTGLLIPLLGAQPATMTRLMALKALGDSQSEDARQFLQNYVRYLPGVTQATADPERPPSGMEDVPEAQPITEEERKIAQKALNRLTLRLRGTPAPTLAPSLAPTLTSSTVSPVTPPVAATLKTTSTDPALSEGADPDDLDDTGWVTSAPVFRCYATIPDGVGNQGMLLSRQWPNGDLMMICTVVNDHHGVVDCFGFYQITVDEFERLVQKFYEENSRVDVPGSYVARQLAGAEVLNWRMHTRIPYEFLCWRVMLTGIEPEVEATQTLLQSLVTPQLSVMTANLYQHPDFDSWFLEREDWSGAEPILDAVDNGLRLSNDSLVIISWLNGRVLALAQAITGSDWGRLLEARLWQCAYLLHCQQTPTFAKLAATEATLLAEQTEIEDLGVLKGRFLLSYVRRCVREELIRLGMDKDKALAELAQRALTLILPLWGEVS